MHELILHHYDLSPYAEKIRLAFGLKGMSWRSVQIPMVMPKPDLTELTGGYRRTPTLQIGADIYCDTKVITRALDRLQPEPPLVPPGDEALVAALSRWAETSFMMVITAMLGLGGTFDDAFVEDRKKMAPDVDFGQAHRLVPAKLMQLRANVDLLDRHLESGKPFLLGEKPSLADLSAYHPLGIAPVHPTVAAVLEGYERIAAWSARVQAIGHGTRQELDSGAAVDAARNAHPSGWDGPFTALPDGLKLGDPVAIVPEETGSGVVMGELLASDIHEIRIRRETERAGELCVHFPREDYLVVAAR